MLQPRLDEFMLEAVQVITFPPLPTLNKKAKLEIKYQIENEMGNDWE